MLARTNNFIISKAPIAQWSFNEGQGLTTQDNSGNGNQGTLQNGVTWTNDSRSGFALDFDGIDDMVGISNLPILDLVNFVTHLKNS